jgi:hypothetical protein
LCPYATPIGDRHLTNAHICNCPTHFALYAENKLMNDGQSV